MPNEEYVFKELDEFLLKYKTDDTEINRKLFLGMPLNFFERLSLNDSILDSLNPHVKTSNLLEIFEIFYTFIHVIADMKTPTIIDSDIFVPNKIKKKPSLIKLYKIACGILYPFFSTVLRGAFAFITAIIIDFFIYKCFFNLVRDKFKLKNYLFRLCSDCAACCIFVIFNLPLAFTLPLALTIALPVMTITFIKESINSVKFLYNEIRGTHKDLPQLRYELVKKKFIELRNKKIDFYKKRLFNLTRSQAILDFRKQQIESIIPNTLPNFLYDFDTFETSLIFNDELMSKCVNLCLNNNLNEFFNMQEFDSKFNEIYYEESITLLKSGWTNKNYKTVSLNNILENLVRSYLIPNNQQPNPTQPMEPAV